MFSSLSRRIIFLTAMVIVPATLVSGCEGDCPIGITNALIGNYTVPVNLVFAQIADSIRSRCLGNSANPPPSSLLTPILNEYHKRAFEIMERAIFKTYFHGKCQDPRTGIDPAGCPNPDCPVVCGTPGSIVHFYDTFRYLAFNATVRVFGPILSENSEAFRMVERRVEEAVGSKNRRAMARLTFIRSPDLMCAEGESVRSTLVGLFRPFRRMMIVACGGTPEGRLNGLGGCSWEQEFKSYILSFP